MLTRLALLICLLAPAPAFAMPQALIAIGLFLGASAATALAVGLFVVQLGLSIGMAVYGSAQQRRKERAARNEYNSKLQDRTITRVATDSPHVYVYGRAKVGSAVVAILTSGDKDQYKHLVCVHAAHECDGIEEIYIAGKPLGALNANGEVTGGDYYAERSEVGSVQTTAESVTLPDLALTGASAFYNEDTGEGFEQRQVPVSLVGRVASFSNPDGRMVIIQYGYKTSLPNVRVRTHLGTPTDTADVSLLVDVPGKWSADAVLRGFCYTVVRLNLNQAEFQGGIPSVEVLLRGKKLYDPRDGSTVWRMNPPLAIYDYLRSEMCGVPAADVPLAPLIAAANVCDASSGGEARYTLNGPVTSDESQSAVLEKMAQAMAGGIVSTTWEMFAGTYVAPIMTLEQSDIVGGIAITPGASDADIYNGVRGQYVGLDAQYVASDFRPYQNPTYVAADGRELWTNIDFPFTNTLQRVHNLARIFVEDQRNGYTVKATFSLKAWSLRIGDRVSLNSALFGWSGKVFRVTDKSYSPTSMIELTLKEDTDEIWDFADAVVVDATPNSGLPNPFSIKPLSYIIALSGDAYLLKAQDGTITSRILVAWLQSTDGAVSTNGAIEVEWLKLGSDTWQTMAPARGDATEAFISPVEDLVYYTIRARTVNPYLNLRSDWTYCTHYSLGKSAPPSDVPWIALEGNTITWGTVGDVDLAGYLLRYHYGSNRSWGDANPLHAGIVTQSPFTPDSLPQGPITLMVKAIDTTGNESGAAALIQARLGDVLIANVLETLDFKAQGFPGTIAGGSVVGGMLKASGTSTFYGGSEADFFKQGDSLPFFIDSYAPMVYETPIFTPTTAAVGSNMTLNTDIASSGVLIEYRVSGGNPMFSTIGSDPFYGDGATNFYGQPDVYQPWPGQIAAKNLQYQFRFTTYQGATQGVINTCNVVIDVPDVVARVNGVSVGASGTRLPLPKAFQMINNVQLTLVSDGGSAVAVQIADKSASLGPLIKCLNASGALVAGTVDAIIQGY